MHFNARYPQPELLCDQPVGTLLICHLPELANCVLMRAYHGEQQPAPLLPDAEYSVVVLGCRVGAGEPGFVVPGAVLEITGAAPVTRMQHVGAIELRSVPKPSLSEADHAVISALIG